MEEIKAAGGVLFTEKDKSIYVLLILRNGVWDLPKGKMEEGETIEKCAIREVEEEVGCKTPENLGLLTTTYHEYSREGVRFGKTTFWYAMTTKTEDNFTPQVEEGINDVAWVSLDEATQKVGFENLEKVVKVFRQWHSENI